jgi:hypothetical protein
MNLFNLRNSSFDELTSQTPTVRRGFRISLWLGNKERSKNEILGSSRKYALSRVSRLPLLTSKVV